MAKKSKKRAAGGSPGSQAAKASTTDKASTGAGQAVERTGTETGARPLAAKPRPTTKSAKRQRQQRINIAIAAGIVTVIVAAIAVDRIREAGRPGERYPSQGNLHLASIVSPHVPYNTNPPTSGPHMPGVAQWGSYLDLAAAPADQFLVHNMEDGGVIIWYQNGTPAENQAKVDALEDIVFNFRRVVIVPRDDFGSEYALTAWTRLQRFDAVDPEGMLAFVRAYEGIDHHPR